MVAESSTFQSGLELPLDDVQRGGDEMSGVREEWGFYAAFWLDVRSMGVLKPPQAIAPLRRGFRTGEHPTSVESDK